jgi:hypothetical protein
VAFSDEEKAKILSALGYPSFDKYGVARGFGHPSAGPYSDLAYGAFDRLSAHGEHQVREDLSEIDCIERELKRLRGKAAISRTSDVTFDVPAARKMLMQDLRRFTKKLADDLGAPISPDSPYSAGPRVRNMP